MNPASSEKKFLNNPVAAKPKTNNVSNPAPDIPVALQKQLELLSKRTNSPLRDLNMDTLNMLKTSGFLDFAIFQKPEDEGEGQKGISVDLETISKAFKLIDEKNGPEKVTFGELKKRMGVINPNLTDKDIAILTNGKNEIKAKDLYDLLLQNELSDFDPLAEAFKLLDPNGSGQLDIDRLRQVFKGLGYGDIEKKDLEILNECMDVNKDGKITIEDFKELFDYLGRPDTKKTEENA